MKLRNARPYLFLAIIHTVLIYLAFPAFFQHFGHVMFAAWGDGFKNYFTLKSYIKSPVGSEGLFKYGSFSYPFGDYVYYTDNTPLFSIPFRWFCNHICDANIYVIPAYNAFIISNILFSSFLVFNIFNRLVGNTVLSFALALYLPWINMQVPRLWEGDFNLSCTLPILLTITLFINWNNNYGNTLKQFAIAFAMVLLLVLSFLLHGYFIAIISLFVAGMLFFQGLIMFGKRQGKLSLLAGILVPAIGLGAVLLLLHSTDKYLSIRPATAMCYDCSVMKTNFLFLFTHYDFHSLALPVATTKKMDMETMVYLGNIGLFAFACIWLGCVFSGPFRRRVFTIQKGFFSDPLRKSVFFAGLLMLVVSFGEHYTTNRDKLTIYTPFAWINHVDSLKLLLIVVVISLAAYGIVLGVSPKARENLKRIRNDYVQRPLKKVLLLLSVALMIFLFVGQYTATIYNVLNPFFYLHFITKEVEQFRSLSRFSWPFFWTFYLWIMYTVLQLYRQSGKTAKTVILLSSLVIGIVEVSDYIFKARQSANNPDLLADSQLDKFKKMRINFNQYQAILPLPYYNVGSEDYSHTIDDNNEWSIYTMQLSLYSGLPLMACKMSRTPPEFSIALLDLVSNDSLQPILTEKLNSKPILIPFEKELVRDPSQLELCARGRAESINYYGKANEFVNRHHLAAIDSMGNVIYYRWCPK